MYSYENKMEKLITTSLNDLKQSLHKKELIFVLGWQDIATRYRRSKVGAWWLTINMLVLITTLGVVFGMLFRQPMEAYLPFLTIGFVFWGLISTSISESCTTFIDARETVLQIRLPYFSHVARVLWRNIIISAHNIIIVPLVFIVFLRSPTLDVLYFIPGFFSSIAKLILGYDNFRYYLHKV